MELYGRGFMTKIDNNTCDSCAWMIREMFMQDGKAVSVQRHLCGHEDGGMEIDIHDQCHINRYEFSKFDYIL